MDKEVKTEIICCVSEICYRTDMLQPITSLLSVRISGGFVRNWERSCFSIKKQNLAQTLKLLLKKDEKVLNIVERNNIRYRTGSEQRVESNFTVRRSSALLTSDSKVSFKNPLA